MSKVSVIVQKAGSEKKFVDAATLGEVRQLEGAANMLASVNGDAETDDSLELNEHDYITFTEQVKGAAPKARKVTKKVTKKTYKKAAARKAKSTKKSTSSK